MRDQSILFINRVFPPDRGATGRCVSDLAERMAAAGWRVTVVADGSGPSDAPPGVSVVRTGCDVRSDGAPGVLAYLLALRRMTVRAMRLPRQDVVVTMTDPPLLAQVGPVLAARHRGASIHWCQDLYPALLPVLGVRVSGPLFGVAERASALALRHHDAVVTIGRCMARRMVALGVPGERITVVPNWADPRIHPVPHANNPFRHQNGLCDGFIVAYSGNLGLAHPMDGVLDAAAELGRTDPDVAILVIGEGRGLPSLVEAVTARGLRNVRFLPFQPAEGLSESLSAADLHLATMDRRAEGLLVPSKISGALAAGRPCLFLGPAGSEAAALVSGCGRVLDPRDGPGLAAAVRVYARDPALCAEEGRRAVATASTWNADAAARSFSALAEAVRKPSARSMNGGAGRSLPHA